MQELHDDVEGFVGVVDDEVLLPDRGEAIAAMLADALGEARVVGRELEVRPVERRRAATVRSAPSMPSTTKVVVGGDVELARRRTARSASGMRASTSSRMTDAAAALLQRRLEQADEILGLFLDLEVAVADDPEAADAPSRV